MITRPVFFRAIADSTAAARKSLRRLAIPDAFRICAASLGRVQRRAASPPGVRVVRRAMVISVLLTAIVAAGPPEPVEPVIAAASSAAAQALSSFQMHDDLVGTLFAAEPLMANPVAFHVDDRGRVFVCESFRQNQGITDNRGHDDAWLDDDLAAQTVEDRRAYHTKHLGDQAASYMAQDDRVSLLVDTDQDGTADQSTVFADHFNDLIEGTGAGVWEHRGDVYYACIPNLWLLRDEDGDGRADTRRILHSGYGVRVAFRGHDLHGLRPGLDGRLYFSVGDRGANVETPAGRLVNPESGAVFRCELDGSHLELYAVGLRNPQELAFDDFGNLFTGDNNSDSGDRARWVYVVEGGDSGWRMAYQYLPDRGPFNRESIWHPYHSDQPAYIVPPVANLADGPSGLDYYPGTGFTPELRGRFVLVDFRGAAPQSGIRSFRAQPDGAFFKLADETQLIWGMLATDVQFGPDGALYASDWVNGWNGEGKGRLYRFTSRESYDSDLVTEVRQLLARRLDDHGKDELVRLLGHADQRVRMKAQLSLVERPELAGLEQASRADGNQLRRLHAIWGLGHLARRQPDTLAQVRAILLPLVDDVDPECRAQAAHVLGEQGYDAGVAQSLRARLQDSNLRVRYFAALSLGKMADAAAVSDVVQLLSDNDNADPIVRHGGIMALSRVANAATLESLATHPDEAVRLAAVVALRRQGAAGVAVFLQDASSRVVVEAARAIHDVPIVEALPALAQRIERDESDDALLRRTLNANFRLGEPKHAAALAQFAARDSAPRAMRLEAIAMLGEWPAPRARDRVLGMWRPLPARTAEPAAAAVRPMLAALPEADAELRLAASRVASELGVLEAVPILKSLVSDNSVSDRQRAQALRALVRMTGAASLPEIQLAAADQQHAEVRAVALELLAKYDPAVALPVLREVAFQGKMPERQAAITGLGELPAGEADKLLAQLVQQLIDQQLPAELHLETLTSAATRQDPQLKSLLAAYDATRDPQRAVDTYRETMYGGNAERGRQIFFERAAVSCVRCHKVGTQGGEVGPELTGVAVEKKREYLLESLVDPNQTIAKGFESAMVIDTQGRVHVGVVKSDTAAGISLMDAEGKLTMVPKDEIDERTSSKSAMPADLITHLSKQDLRDLIEFLAGLRDRPVSGG